MEEYEDGDAELDRFLASNPAAKQAFDRRMRAAEAKAIEKVAKQALRYGRRMPTSCGLESGNRHINKI